MHGIVYKLTNFYNGKSYIGQTIRTLTERINAHFSITKEKIQKGDLFGRAKLKYGRSSFDIEILKECISQKELDKWEIFYIAFYNTVNKKYGYNITKGGGGVFPKQRINFNITEDHKRKIGFANTGSKNGMHKSKNRESYWSKRGEENYWFGKKGELSPRSFEYILTFPDKHHEKIIGLSEICRKYNLNKGAMGLIAKTNIGYHKGYTIRLTKNFMIGGKLPTKQRTNFKKYKITDKEGHEFIVENGLQQFIDEHKLKNFTVSEFSRFANSRKGERYYGYLIEKIK